MRMFVISYKKSNFIDAKVCGRKQFFGFLDHIIIFVLHGLHQRFHPLIHGKINFLLQIREIFSGFDANDTGYFPEDTWEILRGTPIDRVSLDCTLGKDKTLEAGHMGLYETVK